MHAHRCKQCQTVFYHSNEMRGNVNAHKCPACGASEWEQFAPENAKLPNFNPVPVYATQATGLDRLVGVTMNIVTLVMLGAALVLVGVGVYRAIKDGGGVQA